MMQEFRELGEDFGDMKNPSAVQAAMASEKVKAVLSKYQWDQSEYMRKFTAIAAGYALLRMEEQLAQLPEQQRAMVKAMMEGQMAQYVSVHPSDVALVRKQVDALTALFESQ